MAKRKLPSGQFCFVDEQDLWLFDRYKFHLASGKGYVVCDTGNRELGTRKVLSLHRLIMNPKLGYMVDHINRNKLDNRRKNLRVCDNSSNLMNRGPQINNTSGLKGVYWSKQKNKWRVYCSVRTKQYHLGFASTLEEAKEIYSSKIKKYHGEFSRLN